MSSFVPVLACSRDTQLLVGLLEFLDDGFVLLKWTLSLIPFYEECGFQPVIKGLKETTVEFNCLSCEHVIRGEGGAD